MAPRVKKISPVHEDERGEIIDVLLDGEEVRHTGIITSKAGARRGNHYHKKATEYIYVVRGRARWISKDVAGGKSAAEETVLEAGDLLTNPPLTAHAVIFLEDTDLIEMSTLQRIGREYEKDTVFYKLIEK